MKIKEFEGEQALFYNTPHGEQPTNVFYGSDITKKDNHRLKGNLKKVLEILLKLGWHTNEELFAETHNFNCDRYRRYVAEGYIENYYIEKKNCGNGIFKYRIVKK